MSGPIRALAAATLALAAAAAAAGAQTDPLWEPREYDPEPRFELFLSSLFANSASEGSFGLRGSRHFKRRFALEGSLSRISDDRVDLWIADVSAKYYVRDRGKTGVYFVGGPGLFYSDDADADEVMVHLGFGAEFDIGKRLYFRPELRGRWFVENVDAVNILDLALGFGWRF